MGAGVWARAPNPATEPKARAPNPKSRLRITPASSPPSPQNAPMAWGNQMNSPPGRPVRRGSAPRVALAPDPPHRCGCEHAWYRTGDHRPRGACLDRKGPLDRLQQDQTRRPGPHLRCDLLEAFGPACQRRPGRHVERLAPGHRFQLRLAHQLLKLAARERLAVAEGGALGV